MSDTMRDMADQFDRALLKVLKDGRTIIGPDGEERTIDATAADLNVIRQRLKDCGMTVTAEEASPIKNIVEEMRRRQLRIGTPLANDDKEAV
jgi:hypothetical protein